MRLSELHAMEAKLQQQAMRSAIDSTKTSIRASHAQERKQFRESRRPAASAGKLGRGGRRPSLASARSVESSGVEAVQAPLRLATDPATAGCAQPVVTARVLKVADEALAAARRRPGHSRRTGSAGDSVDGDDIDDEAGHSRRGSGPSAGGATAPGTAPPVAAGPGGREEAAEASAFSAEEQIASVMAILKRTSKPGSRRSRSEMSVLRTWLRSAHPKLFGELPRKTLDSLVRRVRLAVLSAGQMATLQGFPGHAFYLILQGSCGVRVASSVAEHRYVQRVAADAGIRQSGAVAAVRDRVSAAERDTGTALVSSSSSAPDGAGAGAGTADDGLGSGGHRRAATVLDEVCRAPIFAGTPGRPAPPGYITAQTVATSPDPFVKQTVHDVGAGAAMSSAALAPDVLRIVNRFLAGGGGGGGGWAAASAAAGAAASQAASSGPGSTPDGVVGPGGISRARGRRRSSVGSLDSMWSVDPEEARAMEGLSSGTKWDGTNPGRAEGAGGDDEDGGPGLRPTLADGRLLGKEVVVLRKGQHFGELALLSDDDRRNASVVALEEGTALVALARSTYLASLRERNQREYELRTKFLLGLRLFGAWSRRRVLPVAYSLQPVAIETGSSLYRRGDVADGVYLIRSGTVRLTAFRREGSLPLRPRTDETGSREK
ncbi:hypothetical protein FNF28_01827 [Cafeteria roenbergensis]|uniref:Cyclic nucleotide-binding domain-containing protein n=1 Tax=Cafeteria roenbergensis TaxID=33653 RepID=A0A5A8E1E3_CAFRO|nr:hypothetical protein FNF28_01827 [Cafeteria roenbergensis]